MVPLKCHGTVLMLVPVQYVHKIMMKTDCLVVTVMTLLLHGVYNQPYMHGYGPMYWHNELYGNPGIDYNYHGLPEKDISQEIYNSLFGDPTYEDSVTELRSILQLGQRSPYEYMYNVIVEVPYCHQKSPLSLKVPPRDPEEFKRIDFIYTVGMNEKLEFLCDIRFDVRLFDYITLHFQNITLTTVLHTNRTTNDRLSRLECLKLEEYVHVTANTVPLKPCGQSRALTVTKKLRFKMYVRQGQELWKHDKSVLVSIIFHYHVSNELFHHVPTDVNVGHVTTFMFDGQFLHNFEDIKVAFVIRILSGEQLLMISFSHFDVRCEQALVRLFRAKSEDMLLNVSLGYSMMNVSHVGTYFAPAGIKCGPHTPGAQILDDSIALVFVNRQSKSFNTGFKLSYSIHSTGSEAPQQLQGGPFNCTVPFFAQFAHHLSCNLRVECEGGEDERNCSYSSDECGPGNIDAGNKCYKYFRADREYFWNEAADFCSQKRMTLVSPQTPQEWDSFLQILTHTTTSALFFVGLKTSVHSGLYANTWQWADGTSAFYNRIIVSEPKEKPLCAFVFPVDSWELQLLSCQSVHDENDVKRSKSVLCEFQKPSTVRPLLPLKTSFTYIGQADVEMIECSEGHFMKDFLSCGHCGTQRHVTLCETPATGGVAMFKCSLDREDGQTIPYTLVCDYREDCYDGSDETFCEHDPCHERQCRNGQCVNYDQWCDGMIHCVDGSDEECPKYIERADPILMREPPAVVHFDGYGDYSLASLHANDTCPDSHFTCADGFCIPVFLRCNGHYDCLDHQDEADCDSYKCPGYYRCYNSRICVHADNVCDGVFHCPQQDDELLCDFTCPQGCRCQGLAFVCATSFPVNFFREIRYLDISGSGMTLNNLSENVYLVSLDLSSSGLRHLQNVTLPNLRLLDLSFNLLKHVRVQSFQGFPRLRELRLSDNPLQSIQPGDTQLEFSKMYDLDLSRTKVRSYHSDMLWNFPNLKILNLSRAGVSTVAATGFNSTRMLEVLDLRECPMKDFPRHVFQSLTALRLVHASNYKLCCTENLPINFNIRNCYAPEDELASCDDLLRSDAYRVSLWVMTTLASVGNIASLVMRQRRQSVKTSFDVFVTNLNVADLLMGVYLMIVGVADHVYRGDYLWRDDSWKTSPMCKMAGFLSLLSSESSACLICLITLDRFLALRFVFSSFRFGVRGALLACGVMWTFTASLSAIPLLPMTSHWEFFSQNGICLPLPVTRKVFEGHSYAFGIMIVLNMVLFLLIAAGQLAIYKAVQGNSFMSDKKNDKEATIARRLITIALSDFLCWFPVGCLGILAYRGMAFPSEVNVGLAIFVLPFNSALNPFLYTLNVLLEKRRKAARARMMEQLVKRLASERQVKHVGTMTSCEELAD